MRKLFSLLLSLICQLFLQHSYALEITFTPEMTQAAIQKQIDSPVKFKKLVFSPGVYTRISSLKLTPDLVSAVNANGAKFLFPTNQGKFVRYFNVIWSSNMESPSLIFDGGEFDMNEQNQSRVSYSKEHQAAIFVDATAAGKLNLAIQNVTVRNSAGDGISIYRNSMVSLSNIKINECFRGGLTVTAGGNEITVNDLDARGKTFRTGLRFEPGSVTSRQTPAIYLLNSVRTNYLNFQLGAGSNLTLANSMVEPINPQAATEGFQGYIYNEGGKLVFENCLFYSNRPLNFQLTGDSRISNSEFKMSRYDETDNPLSAIAITLRWHYGSAGKFNNNQKFVLNNCDFSFFNNNGMITVPNALRTFETHPYGNETNHILIKDVRFAKDQPWGTLFVYAGKVSKTKLILRDNLFGEAFLENKN